MSNIQDAVERAKKWPTDPDRWVREAEQALYGSESKSETVSAPTEGPTLDSDLTELTAPEDAPRILFLDIETRPNLAYIWNVWKPNYSPDGLIESQEIICWAAKWHGESGHHFASVYHHGKQTMLDSIHFLLDEADIVVHYYGRMFDIPHINREFLLAGMSPPSPYRQVDLYDTIKRKFEFTYNKLGFVSQQLGLSGKKDSPGFQNWIACLKGDEQAWEIMRKYNIQDVVVLEELYDKLLPWISSHPSHAAFTGNHVCPSCGSNKLQRRGTAYTQVSQYQRWQCTNCGGWSRTTKRESGVNIRQVADG